MVRNSWPFAPKVHPPLLVETLGDPGMGSGEAVHYRAPARRNCLRRACVSHNRSSELISESPAHFGIRADRGSVGEP